jgi:hypothetical protein
MSDSLVLVLNRVNELHVIDPDSLPHSDGLHPIVLIAVAVINAGFQGVAVDEGRLSNGRSLQALSIDRLSPEGQMLQALCERSQAGFKLPSPEEVVQGIQTICAARAGRNCHV